MLCVSLMDCCRLDVCMKRYRTTYQQVQYNRPHKHQVVKEVQPKDCIETVAVVLSTTCDTTGDGMGGLPLQ